MYEQEVRFIYDLSAPKHSLTVSNGRHLLTIIPDILKEVIVGFRARPTLVRELVKLYRDGRIGTPKLFYTACHPYLYEVQVHETNDEYLLDYFSVVLPNQ